MYVSAAYRIFGDSFLKNKKTVDKQKILLYHCIKTIIQWR